MGQSLVIDSQQVQQGGMQVVDFDGVLGRLVAVLVGRSIGHASPNAATGHPKTESVGIVVSAIPTLSEGGAPELAGPEDHGFIQQAARLQVGQ